METTLTKGEDILTKREKQIAKLLAWGATKKEIANELVITCDTVNNHTKNIFRKIGVGTVNGLSAWYFCTHFNISFDLSPLRKETMAVFLLLCILPRELSSSQDTMRARNGRTRTTRVTRGQRGRRGRRNEDLLLEF